MNTTKIQELETKLDSLKKELAELKAQPTVLVKSWEEAFSGNGWEITECANIIFDRGLVTCPVNKNNFKEEAQAKSALAFAQLSYIVADANGDWVADWEDSSQSKYIIEAIASKFRVNRYNRTKYFLSMKSEEIAKACLEKHRTL